MRIAKTLTMLAVVALLLNGCACKDKIAGDKTGTQAIPSSSPTPKP
jgi:type IV pilus biogenesis protein CpaD/CtpE